MSGYRIIISLLLLGGLALAGCGATNTTNFVNSVLNFRLQQQDDGDGDPGLTLRLINGSLNASEELQILATYQVFPGSYEELEVELVELRCDAGESVCEVTLPDCPIRVEVLEEIRRSTEGLVIGGRDLGGVTDFVFDEGDFNCGSFILYTFSDIEADAVAY